MRDTKKRPVVEPTAPSEQTPKTQVTLPETDNITNQLKEAERGYGGLVEVCSFCGELDCFRAPRIWVKASDVGKDHPRPAR